MIEVQISKSGDEEIKVQLTNQSTHLSNNLSVRIRYPKLVVSLKMDVVRDTV